MTFATVCGIVIFLAVTGLFLVISLVGMIASDSASTKVKDNSVFVIRLSGSIEERSQEGSPIDAFLGMADMSQMGLDNLIASIRKAKDNDDIKGIYLEDGTVTFDSPASAQQLRDALKDFQKERQVDCRLCRQLYASSLLRSFYCRQSLPQQNWND